MMNTTIRSVFARRLRQARQMRMLSLRSLAAALQGAVSHNALAKYEAGVMMPGSDVLGKLADALGQPPDFFFRPFVLRLERLRFRKHAALGVKQQQAVREQALEFFERYHEIEEVVGGARPFPGRIAMRPVRTADDAEAGADRLRKAWDLGSDPLPNVVELVENHGVKVYEVPGAERSFDGFSAETEAGPVIALADWLNDNLLRKRMTVLHELAHLVLPLPDTMTEKEDELIAKRFAGALLLPRDTFIAEFGRGRTGVSMAELIELKANFGASIMAIMMRARQLGLIKESVFLQFSKQTGAWRTASKEPGDEAYKGNEIHSHFRQLVQRAVTEGHISISKGADLLHEAVDGFRLQLQERFA